MCWVNVEAGWDTRASGGGKKVSRGAGEIPMDNLKGLFLVDLFTALL